MKRKHFGAPLCLAMTIALLASCRSSTAQPRAMAEPLPQPLPFEKAFPLAKDIADKFVVGSGGVLWDQMTSEMQQAVGNDREKWKNIATGIGQRIGHVTQTLNERML